MQAGSTEPSTASQPPAKKRRTDLPQTLATDTDETVDLVYPFWWTLGSGSGGSGGGGGGGGGTTLIPNDPLYANNDQLYVRLTNPIANVQKSIGLKTDDTLTLDSSGQVGVKVSNGKGLMSSSAGLAINTDGETLVFGPDGSLEVNLEPNGPLLKSTNGIEIQVDPSTLEVDNWELGVKLDPDEPVDAGPDGLRLNVDDTLLVATNAVSGKTELGVHLNPAGPITADDQGLDLDVDATTLRVDSGTAGGILGVKLKTGGGLESDSNGIYVSVTTTGSPSISTEAPLTYTNGTLGLATDDQTLQISVSGLGVKLKGQGGLQQSAQGIGIGVDETLKIVSNTLEVNTDPDGPLTTGSKGLSVGANAPLTVGAGAVSLDYQAPLRLNGTALSVSSVAPLAATDQGITLNVGNGLSTDTSGALALATAAPFNATSKNLSLNLDRTLEVDGYGNLALKLPLPPMAVGGTGGITIQTTNPIISINGQLGLNVNAADCLTIQSNGLELRKEEPLAVVQTSDGPTLSLKYGSDFTVSNGSLILTKAISNPVATYHCGDQLLSSYDIFAALPDTGAAKVAAYCRLSAAGGMVSGTIQVTGYAGRFPKVGNSLTNGIRFALVLSPAMDRDAASNLSQWLPATIVPSDGSTLFVPNTYGSLNTTTTLPSDYWYVFESTLTTYSSTSFKLTGSSNLKMETGTVVYGPVKSPKQTSSYELLYLGFTLTQNGAGLNFFDANTPSDASFLTPPIPITYLGNYQL